MGSATVTFQDGMKVTAKKNAFLANTEKKKRFIAMLQRHLSESEGRAWPGSLPQHVFSTCHSGL